MCFVYVLLVIIFSWMTILLEYILIFRFLHYIFFKFFCSNKTKLLYMYTVHAYVCVLCVYGLYICTHMYVCVPYTYVWVLCESMQIPNPGLLIFSTIKISSHIHGIH